MISPEIFVMTLGDNYKSRTNFFRRDLDQGGSRAAPVSNWNAIGATRMVQLRCLAVRLEQTLQTRQAGESVAVARSHDGRATAATITL